MKREEPIMIADEKRCQKQVWEPGGGFWGGVRRQCTRRATVTRDGKGYCAQHDPEAVRSRQEARTAAGQAKRDEHARTYRRQALEKSACAGVPDEVLEAGLIGRLYQEHKGLDKAP